ncbi:MAG: class II fumarate hydratase [Acidobacteria bacterium]|nr:class II fumarate hydratase [Acidobacteriota bacterium]MBI3658643.1 class II fumarate hydratase [Acidobacteriota bacterium]
MSNTENTFRIEKDSMGEIRVPQEAYYGAQTQRAVQNFPISRLRFSRGFVRAIGMIKRTAAQVNVQLGLLDEKIAGAIQRAAQEVIDGRWDEQFVIDIFQTGSGTSTNMNANEVIAKRATEFLGGARGSKLVHPNDHVNIGQSSNDVIPTAIHVAGVEAMATHLLPALTKLQRALLDKAAMFDRVIKIGRTHLQDATPVRVGQEFGGYARQVELGIKRVKQASESLAELALGGTAVGTGINTQPEFPGLVIQALSDAMRLELREALNHFEAQGAQDAVVEASGALKTVAVSLMKIANDIRWLASGPRCGLGELALPEVQPGSSIMPGKVNPVIAESVIQVAAQVIGNDLTITLGGQWGFFELNTMMPVMAHNLLESIEILANASANFADQCIAGLQVNEERCRAMVEQSQSMCTALAPEIGYDRAAAIAKEAFKTGKTVREVAREQKVLSEERLAKVLDPWQMTERGIAAKQK